MTAVDIYAQAWAGIGALSDLVAQLGTAADVLAARDWIESRLAALPAPGAPWGWAEVEAWDAGITPHVAATPAEARDAWLARAAYSAGLRHGPLAELGWYQSTPDARAHWQALAIASATVAHAAGEAWRITHPAQAAAADAAASALSGLPAGSYPWLPTGAAWSTTTQRDSGELVAWIREQWTQLGIPWYVGVALAGAAAGGAYYLLRRR